MFETVVIATDGSRSVTRAVETTLDLAARFDASVHALYVADESRIVALPARLHDEVREALTEQGEDALAAVTAANDARDNPVSVTTATRAGRPAPEINAYAREVDADVVALGTRGRDGEHSFHLGSVAEDVVRTCPRPVLTVRQLQEAAEARPNQ